MKTDVLDKIYGKRVVLYGCGRAGENFYLQNMIYPVCDIVLLVDKNVKEIFGRKAFDNSCIKCIDCDCIVVPFFLEKTKENIEESLKDKGINKDIVFIHLRDMNFLSYVVKKEKIDNAGLDVFKLSKWVIDAFVYGKCRDRNYVVSEDKKIAYLRMAKCGCQTFSHCVNSLFGGNWKNNILNREQCFLFTYVRNPFSRLVSCYVNKYKAKRWIEGG